MITNAIVSIALLSLSLSLMHIGDNGEKNQSIYFVGGLVGCLFLSHLLYLTLTLFINLT